MKALFVHDHKFKRCSHNNSTYYSTGTLSSNVWNRYLKIFNTLTVVGRNGGILDGEKTEYPVSSLENVSFNLLPNTFNFKDVILGNEIIRKETAKLVSEHDAIIARLPSRLGGIFIKEAIKQNKPYSIEVVGSAWDALWTHGSLKGKLYAPFLEFQTKRLVRKAKFVIYVTEYYLQSKYPNKFGISSFCSNVEIDTTSQEILDQRLEKIRNLDVKSNQITFGLIGNYDAAYKGIDTAISALSQVAQKYKNWKVQFVGGGDQSKYKKLAKELNVSRNIEFLGRIKPGKDVFNWLDSIDIYLQPSQTEGLPRALIEAMSRGCPCIATNVGGIPELLGIDMMCNPSNTSELSSIIFKMLSSKEKLEKAAISNFEKSKNYYKNEIEQRRESFYLCFKSYINQV